MSGAADSAGTGSASDASAAERYILLGLRLGRHVDGLVDAYYGPSELKEQVDAEPVAGPDALAAEADTLVAGLDDGWLRDQAVGLRTYAGRLAGKEISYSDEAECCYGVRPAPPDTAVYEEAHERVDELLPGAGNVGERFEAWQRGHAVPPDKVVPVIRDVLSELREQTSGLVALPPGEAVDLEEVHDEPWWAFNYYLGRLKSRVVFNLDIPTTMEDVVDLAAHEVYPGHHTERAVKEQLLVRDAGRIEESIQLVPTPAALVAEGIAETGPDVVFGGEVVDRVTAVMRRHGLTYDHARSWAVREARRPLRRVGLDAALLIHEEGRSADDAEAYVRRWSLHPPEVAAHTVRFVSDPTWRVYVITYSAGRDLCRTWVGGDPARFTRLLTEHVRVGDLSAEVSSTP